MNWVPPTQARIHTSQHHRRGKAQRRVKGDNFDCPSDSVAIVSGWTLVSYTPSTGYPAWYQASESHSARECKTVVGDTNRMHAYIGGI